MWYSYKPERSGETDNISVQQIMICTESSEQTGLMVISDHTVVFVLLLHFYHEVDIKIAP
jgi:hypothetical protein